MSRSSIKYIDSTYIYGQRAAVQPVSNPVIYAPFPKHIHKVSHAQNINKILNTALIVMSVLLFISYYFVSDSEKNMNILGREINNLTNENIELQNKLDNLNSFQKMDSVINSTSALDTARKVMEIPSVTMASAPKVFYAPVNYNWSVGY